MSAWHSFLCTPNLPTNIMDLRGFYSSIILSIRGGIPRPIGNFPESLSQAILVGIMLVGRLGVSMLFGLLCVVMLLCYVMLCYVMCLLIC